MNAFLIAGESAAVSTDQVASLVMASVMTVLLAIGALVLRWIAQRLGSVQLATDGIDAAVHDHTGATVMSRLDSIDRRVGVNDARLTDLSGRASLAEQSAASAHRRIDELAALVTQLTEQVSTLTAAVTSLTAAQSKGTS